MGRVYLARQLDLGRQVVVKVMHDHIAADSKFCERFQRETLLMARFQHPYAVTLYDASLNDPQGPCIIMEYVRGVALDVLLKNNHGRINPGRVGRLLGQLCEVLYAAHSAGIVHRDLKPSNLMVVDPDTPYEKVKVMDFGLATLVDQPNLRKGNLTGGDFAVGTPAYICPEQVRGDPVDHRGDLYSVGVMLYEMLTGRLPFTRPQTMDMLLAHATDDPQTFTEVSPDLDIPPAIEAVVMDCLAKQPEQRPASARDLAERYDTAMAHVQALHEAAMSPDDPRSAAPDGEPAPASPVAVDPDTVVYHLEAWMPEGIAIHKLRGFIHDSGGEVIQSVPGNIRVHLGGPDSTYQFGGGMSWFGLNRKTGKLQIDLQMQQGELERRNQLRITVVMRSLDGNVTFDPRWRFLTAQVFCDLRAYLMGQTGVVEDTV
jgi:serine/threonine-protein kinase